MDVGKIIALKSGFVLTIAPEAPVTEAAEMLAENHIGAVVATDAAGRIVGILSERDIALGVPRFGAALGSRTVAELMTREVVTCTAETTVGEVLDIMLGNGIRHVPVVADGALCGVISLRDVVGNWAGGIAGFGAATGAAGATRPIEPFEGRGRPDEAA